MAQCFNSHPLVMVPVSIALMIATTRSFITVCSFEEVLYSSEVESTKMLVLEKSSCFIAFFYQNWNNLLFLWSNERV